jgi:hypothetical protein
MLSLLFAWLIMFFSGGVSAFPENFRLGYKSCSSCHVSPIGGGVLTDYGKSTYEDLATWSFENEGRSDYGLFSKVPDSWQSWINLGGDFRYLYFGRDGSFNQFRMQTDIEAAVHVSEELSLVGSVGVYGVQQKREYRTHYIKYRLNDNFGARVGRFHPAYGVLYPDHTISTRRPLGLDQGKETYNVEASFSHPITEIFLTGSISNELSFSCNQQDGCKSITSQERATYLRAALFTSERSQIGLSYKFGRLRDEINRMAGAFAKYAMSRNLYAISDINYKIIPIYDHQVRNFFTHSKVGYEIIPGVHAFYSHEWASFVSANGIGIQLIPRPHFEIYGVYKVDALSKSWMLVTHLAL